MSSQTTPHELKPNRRYGQHFLINKDMQKKLVRYASIGKDDVVLEVGPGNGVLTSLLVETAAKVVAVEKDPRFVELLREKFSKRDNIEIIQGDILKLQFPKFDKIVANLPYYISSKFILLLSKTTFELAVLTLQKEFVQKLIAENGTSDYGRITVAVQHKMDVRLFDTVSKESFYPMPKVDSLIISLSPKPHPNKLLDETLFDDLTRGLFTQRRRRVEKVLSHYLKSKIGIVERDFVGNLNLPDSRVYEMRVEDFEELSNRLSSISISSKTDN